MIPKVFHFIWLGSPMPAEFEANIMTWRRLHPDWAAARWTDGAFPSIYPELLAACLKPRHAANILRYEILAKFGGVYVDTDFVCQKNIEPLIDGCDLFTARQYEVGHPQEFNNAFFGCASGHPALERLVALVPGAFEPTHDINCGPVFFTQVMRWLGPGRVFDRELFYPFPPAEHERRRESFPNAYAVHGWASRWQPFTDKRAIKPW